MSATPHSGIYEAKKETKMETKLKKHKTWLGELSSIELRDKLQGMNFDELFEGYRKVVDEIKDKLETDEVTNSEILSAQMLIDELAYRTTTKHKNMNNTKEQDALNRICILAAKAFSNTSLNELSVLNSTFRAIMETAVIGGATIDNPYDFRMECGKELFDWRDAKLKERG